METEQIDTPQERRRAENRDATILEKIATPDLAVQQQLVDSIIAERLRKIAHELYAYSNDLTLKPSI